jgi:hypothetical protein
MNNTALCQYKLINIIKGFTMVHEDILKHYDNWGIAARTLGMGSNSLQRWRQIGYIPIQTQYRIETIAKSPHLKADINHCLQQFDKFR